MKRRGISTTGVVATIVFVVGAGIWFLFIGNADRAGARVFSGEMYEVTFGDFEITTPSSGELAAEHKINIHNHLESNAVIIELVDEGTLVEVGDVLLKLNDEKIKDNIRGSELNVTEATNNLQNAKSSFSIAEKKRDSELAVKQLAIDLAELALQAWKEGEVVARRQDLELAVQTADKNYRRLLKKYESSVDLYEQKFLSKDELDQDEIAVLNAEATLKKADLDVVVYENYIHEQQKQKKESDLKQAKDEYERAVVRLESELQSSLANILAKENKLTSHLERLEKLRGQLEACVVLAPGSGMVVYASSMGRWDDESGTISVGKSLHRNQLMMSIPDTSNMIARVKVNEALSGLISKGQLATVTCDALPGRVFEGEVLSVGVLAEGGGWRDPNRRDYTVVVKLLDTGGAPLKPSMRCAAEIYVDQVTNVLFIPIHAVHRDGSVVWVWVQRDGGFAQQPVQLGLFSESYAAIGSGLIAGDVVLLRDPSTGQVTGRLTKENEEE